MTNLEMQACYAIKALAQHAERIATALEAIAKKLDKPNISNVKEATAVLRSITFATKVHDAMSLPEVYDLLCEQASHIETVLGGKEEGQK